MIGVIVCEHLAEQGLNQRDLDQGRGRRAAARDDRRHPVGPRFLTARDRLDQPRRLTQAETGPGPERSAGAGSGLLDGEFQPLDKAGRACRAGRIAACQVGQLVGQDCAQFDLRQHSQKR